MQLSPNMIPGDRSDLDLAAGYFLFVDRFEDLAPASYRRFHERLALPQLQQDLRFLEFLLVLLECLVDILTIF